MTFTEEQLVHIKKYGIVMMAYGKLLTTIDYSLDKPKINLQKWLFQKIFLKYKEEVPREIRESFKENGDVERFFENITKGKTQKAPSDSLEKRID